MKAEEIYKKVVDYLEDKKTVFSRSDGITCITMELTDGVFKYDSAIICGSGYVVYSVQMPLSISDEKLPHILERINEINYRVPIGNLEYRPMDKSIYSKVGRSLNSDEFNFFDIQIDFDRTLNMATENIKGFIDIIQIK